MKNNFKWPTLQFFINILVPILLIGMFFLGRLSQWEPQYKSLKPRSVIVLNRQNSLSPYTMMAETQVKSTISPLILEFPLTNRLTYDLFKNKGICERNASNYRRLMIIAGQNTLLMQLYQDAQEQVNRCNGITQILQMSQVDINNPSSLSRLGGSSRIDSSYGPFSSQIGAFYPE